MINQPDQLVKMGQSLLQIGTYNLRVYILHLLPEELHPLMEWTEEKMNEMKLTKVIAKIPSSLCDYFLNNGYRIEATIPSYYSKNDAACFVAKYYFDLSRRVEKKPELVKKVLHVAQEKKLKKNPLKLDHAYEPSLMEPKDVDEMAKLYQSVFPSYPFPIYDPEYLLETMKDQVDYFGIRKNKKLVALSSIEKSIHSPTAEMTDFATSPELRGKGLAGFLLSWMEKYIQQHYQFNVIYTIARAYSHGINAIFAKGNYIYGGTLTNNTNIHGTIESMNIWYKLLS